MTKPKYMVLGDTHGDLAWTKKMLGVANIRGIKTIFQVGDWGFLWPADPNERQGYEWLESELAERGQTMYFIDGNHDWHTELNARTWSKNLFYMQRGSTLVFPTDDPDDDHGIVLGFMGGAPSIDKAHRSEGVDWFPEEEVTEADYVRAPVDILFTHDAPALPPDFKGFPLGEELEARCARHREHVANVARITQPRLLIHGHYHRHYHSTFEGVAVLGLNCNRSRGAAALFDHKFKLLEVILGLIDMTEEAKTPDDKLHAFPSFWYSFWGPEPIADAISAPSGPSRKSCTWEFRTYSGPDGGDSCASNAMRKSVGTSGNAASLSSGSISGHPSPPLPENPSKIPGPEGAG